MLQVISSSIIQLMLIQIIYYVFLKIFVLNIHLIKGLRLLEQPEDITRNGDEVNKESPPNSVSGSGG